MAVLHVHEASSIIVQEKPVHIKPSGNVVANDHVYDADAVHIFFESPDQPFPQSRFVGWNGNAVVNDAPGSLSILP